MEYSGKVGLVIGKFLPPHKGHKYLIEYAKEHSHKLYVIVAWKESEVISGIQRVAWLKEIHPDVEVLNIRCDHIDDDDSFTWAETVKSMMWDKITHVFCSENYGWAFSSYLGATHIMVDKTRDVISISATQIRSDPMRYWHMLDSCVRAYFVNRIAIVGAESTGTTTLTKKLATHCNTSWVPEYGRMYSEGMVTNAKWAEIDFIHIAQMQNEMEDALAKNTSHLLFCDTTSLATAVFQRLYLGQTTQKVLDLSKNREYYLYVLTYPDIPYEQDGTRQDNDNRLIMHQWFVDLLEEKKLKYIVVKGSVEDRMNTVLNQIKLK